MEYSPSPRPSFDGPAHIPYATVTRHLWGDEESGEVSDWIYVSSQRIHQLVFGLPPGGAFRHSQRFRTIFAADEVLYVLSGLMVIADPASGEVHRVSPGEAVFFRRDTWHHVFNLSSQELRVLELFAPPPASGTSGAYAQAQPYLEQPRYERAELIGRWPMAEAEARGSERIAVIREPDLLWRIVGAQQQALVGVLASTEHLTVSLLELQPGRSTDAEAHPGDGSLYVLEGTLNVEITDGRGPRWSEVAARDGFYIPTGVGHRLRNFSEQPVRVIVATAPTTVSA